MPDLDFVLPGGDVRDLELAIFVGDRDKTMIQRQMPGGHPRVNIALYLQRFPLCQFVNQLQTFSIVGLHDLVQGCVAHRKGVDVVLAGVVTLDKNFLPDPRCQSVWNESAALLIKHDWLGWCRIIALPGRFGKVDEDVRQLREELQNGIQEELTNRTGTPQDPKLLQFTAADIEEIGEDNAAKWELGYVNVPKSQLKLGQEVYQRRCVQCHGVSGDGNGPQAKYLYPRPRDYRRGIYKFTSTPYGSKPRREDLYRTIHDGVIGTSTPSFSLLPENEKQAVIDYVLMLTHRGELEYELYAEADASDELDSEYIPGLVQNVMRKWKQARSQEVLPLTSQPEFTVEHVKRGQAAFVSKGCVKCHGEDGRGQTKENIGKDSWGNPTRAADLTSGMLHGGSEPLDIYRRIVSGINGTPMPGFKNALVSEPETIWDLVAFVLYVSNRRRAGEVPSPGERTLAGLESSGQSE